MNQKLSESQAESTFNRKHLVKGSTYDPALSIGPRCASFSPAFASHSTHACRRCTHYFTSGDKLSRQLSRRRGSAKRWPPAAIGFTRQTELDSNESSNRDEDTLLKVTASVLKSFINQKLYPIHFLAWAGFNMGLMVECKSYSKVSIWPAATRYFARKYFFIMARWRSGGTLEWTVVLASFRPTRDNLQQR